MTDDVTILLVEDSPMKKTALSLLCLALPIHADDTGMRAYCANLLNISTGAGNIANNTTGSAPPQQEAKNFTFSQTICSFPGRQLLGYLSGVGRTPC